MVKNLKRSTGLKWLFSIIAFFITLAIISFFVLSPLLKSQLIQQVSTQTNGAYALEIGKLDLNVIMGNVKAYKISFIPTPEKEKESKTKKDIYTIHAPQVNILGINLWSLFIKKEISIEQLDIIHPEVKWSKSFQNFNEPSFDNKEQSEYKQVPPVHIKRINLAQSHLEILKTDNTPLVSLDNASLRIDAFTYNNREGDEANLKQFNFEEFTFFLRDYNMKLPDSLYSLHFDSLKASFRTASILVNGLKLVPLYNDADFMKKKGEQTDRINMFNKVLHISGVDFKRLKEREELVASLVEIDSLNLLLYRDKRYTLPEDNFVKLPQQMLREAPFYINIDSLFLQKAQITYRERVEDASEPGTINFIDLQAKVYNITNDSILLKNNATITANASTYLMGTGKIKASFSIPIADKNNTHYFEGSLSPMNMEVINPMLENIVFAEIISGNVNEFNFKAQVNETYSKGNLHFGYDNLKIQLNNKDSEKGKKGFMTFLANTFIVKSANPSNNKFRESEMYYERDKRKSVINFWWKTLLSGIKETIGVPKKEEERLDNR